MLGAAAALFARAEPALADPNEVSISPSAIEVAPGGSATVQLIADPPAETLAVWIIDVVFDPAVLATSGRNCDTLDPPAGSTAVGFCAVSDEDEDGLMETVTPLGAIVFNDDGSGLSSRTILADITFEIIGSPGACSDLRVGARNHTDPLGEETVPLVFDGRICIEQDAPPGGTAVPHTPAPRTSEPTPTGGSELTVPSLTSDTPVSGDETPADGTESPSPGQSPSQTPAAGEGGEDGGGEGDLVWVLIVVGVLVAAGGAAWAVVRRRGGGSGTEGGLLAG